MDLSSYLEPKYNADPNQEQPGKDPAVDPDAEVLKLFYDFDKYPPLRAKFKGPGKAVQVQGHRINTWLFEDLTGYEWYVPQWVILSQPQGSFQGFPQEPPGQYIYELTYFGLQSTPNNGKQHIVKVFKKLV